MEKMNVLSCFDGMSCMQLALLRSGIPYGKYYTSEIDKFAIKVTQKNFPKTVQMGDISKIKKEHFLHDIDFLAGGSPCQGFSFAGKGLNFSDSRSKLFFEFVRLREELKPKWFLLENVRMKKEHEKVITDLMGVDPIVINSSLVSAQNRVRLYWTNIDGITQPVDKGILLKDILQDEHEVHEKYYLKSSEIKRAIEKYQSKVSRGNMEFPDEIDRKSKCLTATSIPGSRELHHIKSTKNYLQIEGTSHDSSYRFTYGKSKHNTLLAKGVDKTGVFIDNYVRRLTPIECERLQTVPDRYTDCVSDSQRYKMLGNGWTIDVIAHILSFISSPTH